jgi:glycine hydroxymethyltransferase
MTEYCHDFLIEKILKKESERQKDQWNLIASENICYEAARMLCSSVFTNKYAEGTPERRFYQGCVHSNEIELLAIKRAKFLFNAEYANVQPHCGSSANLISYLALLEKGDSILSMDFSCGGHLSHGHPKNLSSQIFNFIHYGVDPITQVIDYNQIEYLLKTYKPKLLLSGASSYSQLIDYQVMYELAQKYNAYHMVDMAHIAGLVAAQIIPSPIKYADIITSTTHKTLRGPRGAFILAKEQFAKKIDNATMPGVQGGPFMNNIAAKAWLFQYALTEEFINYQKEVINNCQIMIDIFKKHNIPIISNGSSNHLFVVDLSQLNKTGHEAAELLEKNNIIVNKNMIPYDSKSPFVTSGIRIGTPWITAQNKTKEEIIEKTHQIANLLLS